MKLFLFILLSLTGNLCLSQIVRLQSRWQTLVLCEPHHLLVAVPAQKADSIVLTTNNGKIDNEYLDGKMHYTMWPGTAGSATIYVRLKTGMGKSKLLDSATFNVVRRSYGTAGFWAPTGKLEPWMLHSYPYLPGPIDDDMGEHHRKLDSFTVIVYRDKREVFKGKNEINGLFDSATIDFFRYQIEAGDKLVFTDVKMKDCDQQLINLESLEYTISGSHLFRPPRLAVPDTQITIDPVTGNEVKKIKWYRD